MIPAGRSILAGTAESLTLDPDRNERQEQTRIARDDQQDQQRSETHGIQDAKRALHCANRQLPQSETAGQSQYRQKNESD